ncbi:receptor-like protein 11 [Salvia hispanica]|uniref:receptor-like protein 11 n=1 Tax=Salvia hispanica TaxID=49212 RepID=UPI002009D3D7|nr:receptor-like protein 11 [Salvia hispanica]
MLSNLLFFICILISSFIFTTHSYNNKCLLHQETLLLQLRDELIYNSSLSTKLVRWNERSECCLWHGVECDASGHVVCLQLDDEAISGGIGDSSSLFGFKYLQKLNLAFNDFNHTHPIPKGPILQKLGELTFLEVLNLSYNKLAGEIPKGRQIQTFSAESFEGNPGLCGFPLNTNCTHTDVLSPREHEDVEVKREIEWEYVSAALGYVVGFGSIVWLLIFCRSFRHKYFGKIDEIIEEVFDGRNRRRRRARMVARNRVRRQ